MEALPPPLPPSAPPVGKWPVVVGTLAIVFGTGGLLQSLTSPLGTFVLRTQMEGFAEQGADQGKIDAYLAEYARFVSTSSIALGAVALLLLVGGILLLRRRRLSVPLLQAWAVLKIVVGGYFLFRATAMTRQQMALLFESTLPAGGPGGPETAMLGQITSWTVGLSLGMGFLWLAAFPVFLIVWFNRRRIQQQIAAW